MLFSVHGFASPLFQNFLSINKQTNKKEVSVEWQSFQSCRLHLFLGDAMIWLVNNCHFMVICFSNFRFDRAFLKIALLKQKKKYEAIKHYFSIIILIKKFVLRLVVGGLDEIMHNDRDSILYPQNFNR